MRGRNLSEIAGNPADVFLEFGYPELKWLAVSFVFLASLFLICSIFTLARTERRSTIVLLGTLGTWGLFFLAIVRGGQGLWEVWQIAEGLLLELKDGNDPGREYGSYVRSTYWILDTAGGLFILGMLAYISTHGLRLFGARAQSASTETNQTNQTEQGIAPNA